MMETMQADYSINSGKVYNVCLRNYFDDVAKGLRDLFETGVMNDVLLVSKEGKEIKSHRVLLSLFSPYLKKIFQSDTLRGNPHFFPVVIFNDLTFEELTSIVQLVYNKQVSIPQSKFDVIMRAAKILKIHGFLDWDEHTVNHCLSTNGEHGGIKNINDVNGNSKEMETISDSINRENSFDHFNEVHQQSQHHLDNQSPSIHQQENHSIHHQAQIQSDQHLNHQSMTQNLSSNQLQSTHQTQHLPNQQQLQSQSSNQQLPSQGHLSHNRQQQNSQHSLQSLQPSQINYTRAKDTSKSGNNNSIINKRIVSEPSDSQVNPKRIRQNFANNLIPRNGNHENNRCDGNNEIVTSTELDSEQRLIAELGDDEHLHELKRLSTERLQEKVRVTTTDIESNLIASMRKQPLTSNLSSGELPIITLGDELRNASHLINNPTNDFNCSIFDEPNQGTAGFNESLEDAEDDDWDDFDEDGVECIQSLTEYSDSYPCDGKQQMLTYYILQPSTSSNATNNTDYQENHQSVASSSSTSFIIETKEDGNSKDRMYRCAKCNKVFSRQDHCKNHYLSVHLNKRYPCNLCPNIYRYAKGLLRHRKNKHPGDGSDHSHTFVHMPTTNPINNNLS